MQNYFDALKIDTYALETSSLSTPSPKRKKARRAKSSTAPSPHDRGASISCCSLAKDANDHPWTPSKDDDNAFAANLTAALPLPSSPDSHRLLLQEIGDEIHVTFNPELISDASIWSYRDLRHLAKRLGLGGNGKREQIEQKLRTWHAKHFGYYSRQAPRSPTTPSMFPPSSATSFSISAAQLTPLAAKPRKNEDGTPIGILSPTRERPPGHIKKSIKFSVYNGVKIIPPRQYITTYSSPSHSAQSNNTNNTSNTSTSTSNSTRKKSSKRKSRPSSPSSTPSPAPSPSTSLVSLFSPARLTKIGLDAVVSATNKISVGASVVLQSALTFVSPRRTRTQQ